MPEGIIYLSNSLKDKYIWDDLFKIPKQYKVYKDSRSLIFVYKLKSIYENESSIDFRSETLEQKWINFGINHLMLSIKNVHGWLFKTL